MNIPKPVPNRKHNQKVRGVEVYIDASKPSAGEFLATNNATIIKMKPMDAIPFVILSCFMFIILLGGCTNI